MNTFKVNGKEYKAKEFTFNLICDLEGMGVPLEQMDEKPMSMVRAYFGICAGLGKDAAGKEMEQHIIGGGKFDDVMKAMMNEMENSDFFRSLNQKAETETAENQGEAAAETAAAETAAE